MALQRTKKVEEVSYRPSIVTFIDILGFRSIVATRSVGEVRKIVHQVQYHAGSDDQKYIGETDDLKEIANWTRCVFFSDSIVRIRPYDGKYHDGGLFHEILDLVHAQAELANLAVFTRGGLTTGKIYHEKNTMFGPAVVRAYDLESSFANYPRIIIDPYALETLATDKRLRAEHHDLEDETRYIRDLIRQGDDGLYFVDFLGAFRGEMDNQEQFPDYLRNLKSIIVREARDAEERLSILQKYLWLARYLNEVASEHDDCAEDNEILISHRDISSLSEQYQRR